MKRLFTLLFSIFVIFIGISQIPNPSTETIGNVSATTTISAHESSNSFDIDALTYSGTGDIRSSTPSSGYSGASGLANVFLTNAVGRHIIIDGFDAGPNCSTIDLSFGVFKSTTAENGSSLLIEYSESGSSGPWTSAGSITLPTGSGTAIWHFRNLTDLPASLTSIKFSNNSTSPQFRLDDLKFSALGADCTSLPINVLNYKIEKFNNFTNISFSTSSETNNSHFLIEWSKDAKNWNEIGAVKGSGTTKEVKEYSFIHETPETGTNYYRLTQVDLDGRKETYPVKSIYFGSKEKGFNITPSLAQNDLRFELDQPVSNGRMLIYNIDGQLMSSYILSAGIEVLRIDISGLPTGQYIAKYIDGEEIINKKFIKQ